MDEKTPRYVRYIYNDDLDKFVIFTNRKKRDADYYDNSMIYAAAYGAIKVISYLIDKLHYDANTVYENYTTPLMWACQENQYEAAKCLIRYGADVNFTDSYTNILDQTSANGYLDIVKLLLDNGAKIELETDIGKISSLHSACAWNQIEVSKELLMRGADIDYTDEEGSAIFYAAQKGHYNIVRFLLDSNADISILNKKGNTVFDVARKSRKKKIIELLERHKIINS